MRCVVVFLFALQCIICSAIVPQSAYHPVFEYDVPVASQPIVYAAPAVPTGPYYGSYGSYAVHRTPAVSHTYSQTQTHPVAYVKPVTVYETQSAQYYAPSAPSSRVEQSRLFVPQSNQVYRYQSANQQYSNPQRSDTRVRVQSPSQNYQANQYRSYSSSAQYSDAQNGRDGYARGTPYTNNGERAKIQRYPGYRPGIKEEFFDVEERTIVRPAGSALIELDTPSKKQDLTEIGSNSRANSKQSQYNSRANAESSNQNAQYYSTPAPDCGYDNNQSPVYEDQSTVYDYSPPAASFDNTDTQYHPTTFAPTTPTYLPPYSTEQSSTRSYSSTPGQYTPTTTTASTDSASDSSTTPKQSEIYISSTTPVAITIVDSSNNTQNARNTTTRQQDIIYADQQQSDEFTPLNELPPRGDISQYRAEQSDQFYHELPRSRNPSDPNGPVVYTHSHGEPTEFDGGNDQNRTSYENQGNGNAQDDGNVRARVLSVTPPPPNAVPTETVNRRRIVISKPVQIQDVSENEDSKSQNVNSRSEANSFAANANNRNEANSFGASANRRNEASTYAANQANSDASNGVYISTTPSTASQRIIYVQPVSQDFAQQRAVSPRKNQ